MSQCKLLFLIDRTGSMSEYIRALNNVLPSVIRYVTITGAFSHINIVTYDDYNYNTKHFTEVCHESGWRPTTLEGMKYLCKWAKDLRIRGGGDCEAFKSGMVHACNNMSGRVIVLHLGDVPPHENDIYDSDYEREKRSLVNLFDLDKIAKFMKLRGVHRFYSINSVRRMTSVKPVDLVPYQYLAGVTNGAEFALNRIDEVSIRQAMFRVISSWFDDTIEAKGYSRNSLSVNEEPKVVMSHAIPEFSGIFNNLSDKSITDMFDFIREIISIDIMDLSDNPLYGKMWRSLCCRRGDERRDAMLTEFGIAKNKTTPENQEKLTKWIQLSYNQSDEIEEDIEEFIEKNAVNGTIRYFEDLGALPHVISNLFMTLNVSDQKEITRFLTRLTISEEETKCSSNELPLNMPLKKIFSFLTHLFSPGTKLSLRPSACLAMIALKCKCVIAEQAKKFLFSIRSRWINFEKKSDGTPLYPENYTLGFLRLIDYLAHDHADLFTSEEIETARKGISVFKCFHVPSIEVCAETKESKCLEGVYAGWMRLCRVCHNSRPGSIMDKTGKCGYCHYGSYPVKMQEENHLQVECTDCGCIYSRDEGVEVLARARCHYHAKELLKKNQLPPHYQCKICHLRFVDCRKYTECASCANGMAPRKYRYNETPIRVNRLVRDLHPLYASIGISMPNGVNKPYEIITEVKIGEYTNPPCPEMRLPSNNALVCNSEKIWQDLIDFMRDKKHIELPYCSICYGQFPSLQLAPMCGRSGCDQRVCYDCGNEWYDNSRGTVVNPRHLDCAFCSRPPAMKIIRKWNRDVSEMRKTEPFKPSDYYAWCESCDRVCYLMEKSCSQGTPEVKNWKCQDCKTNERNARALLAESKDAPTNLKTCPECKMTVFKDGGCNHISCQCGVHWCWICRAGFTTSGKCYDHLHDKHGGFFTDENENRYV